MKEGFDEASQAAQDRRALWKASEQWFASTDWDRRGPCAEGTRSHDIASKQNRDLTRLEPVCHACADSDSVYVFRRPEKHVARTAAVVLTMAFRFAGLRPLAGVALAAWTQQRKPRECPQPRNSNSFPYTSSATVPYARLMECQSHARSSPVAHSIPTLFDDAISICRDAEVDSSWGGSQAMSSIQKALMSAREDFQREPMIMLVGAFSAGKSTLINSVLDRKACATGIEPTTCDLEFLRWEGVLLVDSAGLDAMNQPTHKEKALEAARRSNMAVVVLNARHPLRDSEGPILRELVEAKSQVVVAINYWNHVEAEEEQKQCLSYVEQTLKEWMPAKQVPIIPINAKKLDDAGVTKLRQTLLATAKKTNRQKDISAKAAIAREVRKMVIELDTFAAAAEEAHQQKCGSLEAVWTLLTKDLNPRRELRARDSEEMHRREQEMQKLQNKHAGIRDSFYETVQKSVGTGAVLSGLLAGAISSWEADEQRSQIEGQIQAKQQQIEDLESKVRTKLKQEEDIIQGFNNQLSDEKMQYQNKVARFEKDRRSLQGLLEAAEKA